MSSASRPLAPKPANKASCRASLYSPIGFELGDRHRLGELGHLRQPLAIGFDRFRAVVEHERIGLGGADPFVAFGRRREEALRAQRRQQPADALAAAFRHRHLTVAAVSRRDIAAKSNAPWCADPIAACSRSALMPSSEWPKSALRMSDSFMISALISARNFCAFCSCNPFQACWNSRNGIALSQSITSPSCLSAARKAFRLLASRSSFLRADARGGEVAQLEQTCRSCLPRQLADLPLQASGMLAHAFAIVLAGDSFAARRTGRTAIAPVAWRRRSAPAENRSAAR